MNKMWKWPFRLIWTRRVHGMTNIPVMLLMPEKVYHGTVNVVDIFRKRVWLPVSVSHEIQFDFRIDPVPVPGGNWFSGAFEAERINTMEMVNKALMALSERLQHLRRLEEGQEWKPCSTS